MKPILSIVLSFAMIVGMGQFCFAEKYPEGTVTIPVSGKVAESAPTTRTVSVDVTWDNMEFTYIPASQGTWSPDSHSFVGATEGHWEEKEAKITLVNHSDTAIEANLSFTPNVTGVTGTFTEESGTKNDKKLELAAASATSTPTAIAKFSIGGAAISQDTSNLGSISVLIAAVNSTTSGDNNDPSNTPSPTPSGQTMTAAQLQELFNAGGEVTLTNNVDMGNSYLTVAEGKNVTLNLNGYTVTGAAGSVIENSGTLRIQGNGGIENAGNGFCVQSSGWLTIQSGEYQTAQGSFAIYLLSGDCTIIGGSYQSQTKNVGYWAGVNLSIIADNVTSAEIG